MNPGKILVWDIPTRLFHWLLAGCFAVAYVTAEAEGWENVHYTAGFTLLGLIAFRVLWGFIGSRYARFSAFRYSPTQMLAYLRNMKSAHYLGHNPLGSMAVFGLLGLGLLTALSGWFMYLTGWEWPEEPHELAANIMLALVCAHIAGVFISSKLHNENLARAMVTGHKEGSADQAITRPFTPLGVLLLAAVIGFWTYSTIHPFDTGQSAASEAAEHQKKSGEKDGYEDDD